MTQVDCQSKSGSLKVLKPEQTVTSIVKRLLLVGSTRMSQARNQWARLLRLSLTKKGILGVKGGICDASKLEASRVGCQRAIGVLPCVEVELTDACSTLKLLEATSFTRD